MPNLSIGTLAAKAGLNTSTLRYYESIGLLPPSERKSGQRRYPENIIERIAFIKIAQQTGFTIPEIVLLLQGFETLPPSDDSKPQQLFHEPIEQITYLDPGYSGHASDVRLIVTASHEIVVRSSRLTEAPSHEFCRIL